MSGTPEVVEISWYVRRPAHSGGWHYDHLAVASPYGYSQPVRHVPAVGDVVSVAGEDPTLGRTLITGRVVARDWMYPSWGSQGWPREQLEPSRGPMMQILIEESPGLFFDEVVRPEVDE